MNDHRDNYSFRTTMEDIYGDLDTDYRGDTSDNVSSSFGDTSESIGVKKRRKRKKKRRKKHYLLRIILFILLIAGLYTFLTSSIFAIDEIRIEDNTLISDEEIINLSGVNIGDNMFKKTRGKVMDGLRENPYIADVKIKRKLPNIYIMSVEERRPVIAVAYEGKFVILDEQGYAVDSNDSNMSATIVTGIAIESYEPGEIPVFEDSGRLNEIRKFIININETGLYFKKLEITSAFSVKCYVTDTLMCLGASKDILQNAEAIKVVLYDLDQKGVKRGVIRVGEDGYASFSPITE